MTDPFAALGLPRAQALDPADLDRAAPRARPRRPPRPLLPRARARARPRRCGGRGAPRCAPHLEGPSRAGRGAARARRPQRARHASGAGVPRVPARGAGGARARGGRRGARGGPGSVYPSVNGGSRPSSSSARTTRRSTRRWRRSWRPASTRACCARAKIVPRPPSRAGTPDAPRARHRPRHDPLARRLRGRPEPRAGPRPRRRRPAAAERGPLRGWRVEVGAGARDAAAGAPSEVVLSVKRLMGDGAAARRGAGGPGRS